MMNTIQLELLDNSCIILSGPTEHGEEDQSENQPVLNSGGTFGVASQSFEKFDHLCCPQSQFVADIVELLGQALRKGFGKDRTWKKFRHGAAWSPLR